MKELAIGLLISIVIQLAIVVLLLDEIASKL